MTMFVSLPCSLAESRAGLAGLILGGASLLLVPAVDFLRDRGRAGLQAGVAAASGAFLLGGVAALLLQPGHLHLPPALRAAAGVLGAFFLFLLVSSLILEIPRAWGFGGRGRARLTTGGTYALARHPGVLWLFFLLVCLSLARASETILLAAVTWTAINIGVSTLEDRFFLPRAFGAPYDEYRGRVPFLIPTCSSIRRCIETFRCPLRRKR